MIVNKVMEVESRETRWNVVVILLLIGSVRLFS